MRNSTMKARSVVLGAMTVLAASVGAQQPNASAAASGLAGNFTAMARGYDAVAWNPAMLGMPGNPGFSMSILPFGVAATLDPVNVKDFKDFQGKTVPTATKQQWLDKVTANNGEKGTFDAGVNLLALSAGPFGFQVGAAAYGAAKLNPDAFEIIMFGNAGKTGSPRTFNFQGSSLSGGALTTAALSYGFGFGDAKPGSDHSAIGITAKYVLGNGVLIARDAGSQATDQNVNVSFPVILPDTNNFGNNGSGFGADVAFAWMSDKLTLGAAVQNAFNTFAWDESTLAYRPGTAMFTTDTSSSNFDQKPFAGAPTSLKNALTNNKIKPTIAAGLAYAWRSDVTLTADAHQQLGDDDAIIIGPKTQAGAGIEYRGIPMLPLRAGASYITGGSAFSGGVGLRIGAYELGFAAVVRTGDSKGTGFLLSALSIH
jgi:hypothetical protein